MWNLEILEKPTNYHDALKMVKERVDEATVNYLLNPSEFSTQFCLRFWLYAFDRITQESPANVA